MTVFVYQDFMCLLVLVFTWPDFWHETELHHV